jgi:hypothetical protein
MNSEERRVIESTCRDYQYILYIKGDQLSCTNAIKHFINVMLGTNPIHARPYRLPEAQRWEVDTQVSKLLQDGIITESKIVEHDVDKK